jgi:hypothetical protein
MGLFGGLLGFLGGNKNRKSQERMHAQDSFNNSPQGIRANAEEAGFNPLTVLTSGRSFGAGYAPVFGNEYAALGQGLDDFFAGREAEKIQRSQLVQENQRLKELVEKTRLSPPVPGMYARPQSEKANASPQGSNSQLLRPSLRAGGPEVDVKRDLTVVTPYGELRSDPNWTPTEDIETEYGEPAAWLYSGVRAADFMADQFARAIREATKKPKPKAKKRGDYPSYNPALNPPLRGYYGPPGSRTGF